MSTGRGADERVAAVGLIGISIVSVQLGAALATEIFDDIGFAATVALRLALAVPVMVLLWPARIGSWRREQLLAAGALGVAVAGMNFAFYGAIDRIPLGLAVALEFLGPLAVATLAARRASSAIWVLVAGAGVYLITNPSGGGLDDGLGVALALVAASFWAAYIVLTERLGRLFSEGSGLTVAVATAALLVLPVGVADAGSDLFTGEVLAIGFGVAMLSAVITYAAELAALRRIHPGTFGVLMSLEPAVAALIGFWALSQSLSAGELAGIACVAVAGAGAIAGAPTKAAARQ